MKLTSEPIVLLLLLLLIIISSSSVNPSTVGGDVLSWMVVGGYSNILNTNFNFNTNFTRVG